MKILISGGSGMIGQAITGQARSKGHEVAHLSRSPLRQSDIPQFHWDVEKGVLDHAALEWAPEVLINLAGAPIDGRWTAAYKSEIYSSRVNATRLLMSSFRDAGQRLKIHINASAVGYYPNDRQKVFREEDGSGKDFLSEVCVAWEREAQFFEALADRLCIFRIGIVLSEQGGALPKLAQPIKWGLGAPLGSGRQWMPWIHLEDVAASFIHALESESLSGIYNIVGPKPVTQTQLTKACAEVLNRPLWLPKIPAAALKLLLGEMAETVLASNRAVNDKLEASGFTYAYPDLREALQNCLK